MASMVGALRQTSRLINRQSRRTFRSSALYNAAQNFTMPALSPTMTEGNIAAWRVKEGDSFAPGDVLLEIETDKATMDVEAQEEGIMFKILQQDGTKGIQVGARIAVLAEDGDDLSSLQVPAEESSQQASAPATKEKSPSEDTKSSPSQAEAPPTSKSGSDTSVSSSSSSQAPAGKARSQKYPLYPAVLFALKENGLTKVDADKIPASGPGGRLLKGDVLAYAGKIAKDYSANQSKRVAKLGHMDLSNIEVAAPAKKPEAAPKAAEPEVPVPQDTEIAMHISLSAVIATQKRVQDTLDVKLPLSVFIARASELANEDLPLVSKAPTADDLFYSVLGLDAVIPQSSRGNYFPLVTGLPASVPVSLPKKRDIFDELLGSKPARTASTALPPLVGAQGVASSMNIFSVVARPGEEKRVEAYLEKMKLVLEAEPGRLVV